MRKIGAFFASLVILFGFPMPTINAASVAVKNGATCTQLRSVVKLAADQYICLKSGNKKLWTKLIKAKTPDLPIISVFSVPILSSYKVEIFIPEYKPVPAFSAKIQPFIEASQEITGKDCVIKDKNGNSFDFIFLKQTPITIYCFVTGFGQLKVKLRAIPLDENLPILFSETPWVNFDFGSAPPINQEKPVGPASGSIPNVVLDGLCAPLGAIQTTSMGEAYSCKASSVDGKGRWSK